MQWLAWHLQFLMCILERLNVMPTFNWTKCVQIFPLSSRLSLSGGSMLLPNTNKCQKRGEEITEGHEGREEEADSPSPVNWLYQLNKD